MSYKGSHVIAVVANSALEHLFMYLVKQCLDQAKCQLVIKLFVVVKSQT